jgi:glycine/D-amino acid oxidase-like deaminating enzyme
MAALQNWGNRPWVVDFPVPICGFPFSVDFAVVGGGFTGLAAAARLKRLSQESSVAVFEAAQFGAGSSGHSGGVALAESASGDLPGLGDVLAGYRQILHDLRVDGDLILPGAYELGRTARLPDSPIRWQDSGELTAVKEVPGGTVNPGKVVTGLARAAEHAGVLLFENAHVNKAVFGSKIELHTNRGAIRAKKVLLATNAFSLELSGLLGRARASFTLAVATSELTNATLAGIGLGGRKAFYTVDLPYLWGRLLGNSVIFGSGLVFMDDWRSLATLDIQQGETAKLFARLEKRVRALHPALRNVDFTHRWGGPICITEEWQPVFEYHPKSRNAIVLGAYSGHGVAQSVYLGAWAAEALLGKRELPSWR